MSNPDPQRVQILRQQIARVLGDKQIPDVMGALSAALLDVMMAIPGVDESTAVRALDAFAADAKDLLHKRFQMANPTGRIIQ